MKVNSSEFKIQGYTLTVDHNQPDNFGKYDQGIWTYSLVMDIADADVLNNKAFTVDGLCADIQSHLLRCEYRPDPFYLFLAIEQVRNTLNFNLSQDLHRKVMENLTTAFAAPDWKPANP